MRRAGDPLLLPERPKAALHLCLCGNHMWAAPYDADVWEVNNFDLTKANFSSLSDAEYQALPPEEKDLVVHWDRHNDPVVKMFLEDELPDAGLSASDYFNFTIEDDMGVLAAGLR